MLFSSARYQLGIVVVVSVAGVLTRTVDLYSEVHVPGRLWFGAPQRSSGQCSGGQGQCVTIDTGEDHIFGNQY